MLSYRPTQCLHCDKSNVYTLLVIIVLGLMLNVAHFGKITQFLRPNTPLNKRANVTLPHTCTPFHEKEKKLLLDGFVDQVYPRLLELIRCEWIHPPSKRHLKLRHLEKKHFSQAKQSKLLDDFMGHRTGSYHFRLKSS